MPRRKSLPTSAPAQAEPAYKVRNLRDEGRNKIVASDDVFPHSSSNDNGMRLRVTVAADRAGMKKAITRADWEKQQYLSKQLYARVPEISGAIMQKNLYAIGDAWLPRFVGKNPGRRDEVWGNEAEFIVHDFFQSCDIRGEPYDFYTSLFLDGIAYDRDGDALMVTVDQGDMPPKFAFYPSHRVASRYDHGQDSSGFGRVPAGRFKGAKIYNGVIYSNSGQAIAVNVLGESAATDQQFSLVYSPNDNLLPEAQFLYEPEWQDQGRGISRIINGLMQWMDYEDIHYFLKRQVKQDSAQGILHYNEEGAAPDSLSYINEREDSSTNTDLKVETLEGNEITYFRAMGGGKIEPFRSDRPHPNVDNYTMRILRGAMQPLGWFYELYDPSKIGGASTRLIQDMARMSIRARQKTIYKRAIRAVMIRLAWAVEHRELPMIEGWEMWDFTRPAKLTVDARYDEKTWETRLRNGTGTYSGYYGEKGDSWWEDEIRQRIKEQKFIQSECDRQGVDINRIQLLTPNGNMPTGSEPAGKEPEEGEE